MRAIHCNALVQMKRDKDESNSLKFANGHDMAQMEREKRETTSLTNQTSQRTTQNKSKSEAFPHKEPS